MYFTKDLAEYICNNLLTLKMGDNMYVDFTPESPDNVAVLTEYGGVPLGDETNTAFRRVQVKVRNIRHIEAKKLIFEIYRLFKEDAIDLAGLPCPVEILNTPVKIDIDKNNRFCYAFNVVITVLRR